MSTSKNHDRLVVILGPTASRKSSLAIALAKKFSAEIIAADSMQIYTGMDIGTGKVSKTEQRAVKHHLIDILPPDHSFTLAQWQKRAFEAIDSILEQGRLPFLVGGTGLYLSSILDYYHIPHATPNTRLRNRLNKETANTLFARLRKLDPQTAAVIDSHNKRRLTRALEHVLTYKTSFSEAQQKDLCPYETLILGVEVPKNKLYQQIDQRVLSMYRRDLLSEVKKLRKKNPWSLPAMQAIGYKEWKGYLDGTQTLEATLALIQKNSRNYAKRQMTWFRGMEKRHAIHWIENQTQAEKLIRTFLRG